MSNYNIFEKVNKLEESVIRLHRELSAPPYYSPWEHNQNPETELMWRYNRTYFNNAAELYGIIKPDMDKRTFVNYISQPKHISKATAYGIQPVLARKISDRTYITTDGVPISTTTLMPLSYNTTNNIFRTTKDGRHTNHNRAVLVMTNFLYAGEVEPREIFFLDGDWTNCRINNLSFRDRVKGEKDIVYPNVSIL